MSHVPLIATGSHRYNGVWLKSGDRFTADCQTDADELCCLGFAVADRDAMTYATRALTAEPAPEVVRQKRAYRRRDLVAER